jgi:NAD(P)-dependent dehydrogenase (short-subunit alcohol dehydrogenase family)
MSAKTVVSRNVSLQGHVAIVSGGARGIGAAVALELARQGARVAVFDALSADQTLADASSQGAVCKGWQLDISDEQAVERAAAEVQSVLGPVSIVVAAAGVMPSGAVDSGLAQWRRVLAVNLDGARHLIAACYPGMAARGDGRIVLVSSVAAAQGGLLAGAEYSASKGALISLGRHVARNGAAHGVRCNIVSPGVIETDMNAHLPKPDPQTLPARRLGIPQDVAGPVAFLCSDRANYVTGIELPINGGQLFYP